MTSETVLGLPSGTVRVWLDSRLCSDHDADIRFPPTANQVMQIGVAERIIGRWKSGGDECQMKPIIAMVLAISVAGCLTDSERLASPAGSERLARPAVKYDGSWYKTNGWSGEYPDGFTIARNITTKIRGTLDVDAPKSISCLLRKGATYHPWNKKRIVSDRLEFASFTKIETYELDASFTIELRRQSNGDDTTIQFKKGDRWLYLAGLAEERFLIKFNEAMYIAGQELYEKSTKVDAPVNGDESTYDEWLKLRCANGAVGWILFNEIKDSPDFTAPNTGGYDNASDL